MDLVEILQYAGVKNPQDRPEHLHPELILCVLTIPLTMMDLLYYYGHGEQSRCDFKKRKNYLSNYLNLYLSSQVGHSDFNTNL